MSRPHPVLQHTEDKKTFLHGPFDFGHARAPVARPETTDTEPQLTPLKCETVVSFDTADGQVQDTYDKQPAVLHEHALSGNPFSVNKGMGRYPQVLTLNVTQAQDRSPV